MLSSSGGLTFCMVSVGVYSGHMGHDVRPHKSSQARMERCRERDPHKTLWELHLFHVGVVTI